MSRGAHDPANVPRTVVQGSPEVAVEDNEASTEEKGDRPEAASFDTCSPFDELGSDTGTAVTLYARSEGQFLRRRRQLSDALMGLARSGTIEKAAVQAWPAAVTLEPTGDSATHPVIELYRSIRTWANRAAVDIDRPFCVEEMACPVTEERYTRLRLPVFCLVMVEGNGIRGVAPCRQGETVVTIGDAIRRLENGRSILAEIDR